MISSQDSSLREGEIWTAEFYTHRGKMRQRKTLGNIILCFLNFFYWLIFIAVCVVISVICDSLRLCGLQPTRILCPRPPPGDLPQPGTEPTSPELQMDSSPMSHQGNPGRVSYLKYSFLDPSLMMAYLWSHLYITRENCLKYAFWFEQGLPNTWEWGREKKLIHLVTLLRLN